MKKVMNKENLTEYCLNQKLSDKQVSEIFCVHHGSVGVARRRYGIKLVPKWDRDGVKKMTEEQVSLVDGSILGDGGIELNHSDSYVFSFSHSEKQHHYCRAKADILGEYTSSIRPRNDGCLRVRSIVHPIFMEYGKECYSEYDGIRWKRIPDSILDRLNALSLAIWYGDDGCHSGNQVWFCVGCKDKNERENTLECLESRFGFKCSIKKMSNEECWRLYIWKRSQDDFFDIVSPFISALLPYKIPSYYKGIGCVNQQPSLARNGKEGSETMSEAKDNNVYAGTLPILGNYIGTPEAMNNSQDIVRTVEIS